MIVYNMGLCESKKILYQLSLPLSQLVRMVCFIIEPYSTFSTFILQPYFQYFKDLNFDEISLISVTLVNSVK